MAFWKAYRKRISSFAMALLNKGTDIYTIAKLMGHRSVTSTQVYAKLSDEQLRRAILKL